MRTLYDLMVRLESLQERLYNAVVTEISARRAAQSAVEVGVIFFTDKV